jgi:choline oxidase
VLGGCSSHNSCIAFWAELRVKGVTGLRVANGSVMPFLTTVNPCITTMMIGEKCADLLKTA